MQKAILFNAREMRHFDHGYAVTSHSSPIYFPLGGSMLLHGGIVGLQPLSTAAEIPPASNAAPRRKLRHAFHSSVPEDEAD